MFISPSNPKLIIGSAKTLKTQKTQTCQWQLLINREKIKDDKLVNRSIQRRRDVQLRNVAKITILTSSTSNTTYTHNGMNDRFDNFLFVLYFSVTDAMEYFPQTLYCFN